MDGRNKSCGCLHQKDVLNKKFGKLTAISKFRNKNRSFINCKCDCGNNKIIEQYKLSTGHTKSCGQFICNGIDRIDSTIGYLKNNCVSCCSKCNYMKMRLDKKEFIEQCIKISQFQMKNNKNEETS